MLALAGCGGEAERPALPPEAGAELAAAVADVTAALEAGDAAGAQQEVDELLAAVEATLGSGDVPRPLARQVRGGAERLAALVKAAQPPPPPPPVPEPPPEDDDEDDDDRGKGNDKNKDRDKDDDD